MRFDTVFLSYDEPECDKNWLKLLTRVPEAKRIHGVTGIWEAHQACACIAETANFFLVDGDTEILEDFSFPAPTQRTDILEKSVFLWRSINPVNDLVNGFGSLKLAPRSAFIDGADGLDMTTCIAKKFITISEVASITRFNTSPLSAWRAGFRECAKISGNVLAEGTEWERKYRLQRWCNKGHDRPFGDWCIRGAHAGRAFGSLHRNDHQTLKMINDYGALHTFFHSELRDCSFPNRVVA